VADDTVATDPWSVGIYPKAQVLNRFIAKFVDLLLVAAVGKVAPPVGWLAGLVYVLIADGLPGGRSIGKRLAGLQTIVTRTRELAGFRESIIRNLPLACAYLLFAVPYIGWIAGMFLLGFEALLIIGNDQGRRIGDDLAHTQVLDADQFHQPD
jgi:uncharacterized RDD family membrane protein YckC